MKIIKILQENTIKPYHRKIVKVMSQRGVDNDPKEVWDFITDELAIDDLETKTELLYLYDSYYDKPEEIDNMSDSDLNGMENYESFDDEHIALSLFLNLPPQLISEMAYEHYGLKHYIDHTTDSEYAVGEDYDVTKAMERYFDGWVDNVYGGIDNAPRELIEDWIEIDSYSISELAREEAENKIENMSDEDIIAEAGYDREELEDAKTYDEDKIGELDDEIYNLESELDDLESDNEDGELDSEIDDLMDRIEQLNKDKQSLADRVIDLESELDNLLDTAKDELLDKMTEDFESEILYDGVDWFIDRGYSFSDAVNGYFTFDESGLENYLVENEDRGSALSPQDGSEYEQFYNNEYYYIYQTA